MIKALVDAPSKRSRDQTEEVVTGQSGKTEPGTQVTPTQSDDDRRLRQPVLQPNFTHTQEVVVGGAPRPVGAPRNTVTPDGTDGPSPAVQKNRFKISRQDDLTAAYAIPAHFHDVTGNVVTMLENIVASCYALGSLVVLVFYSCLLGIAREVVFIIPRLFLYFALDSCTKFDFHIVIYRR